MRHLTGPRTDDDLFGHSASCAHWCQGHIDETAADHTTDLDYFGSDGVALTQPPGQPAVVSLIGFRPAQHDFTPERARLLAFQLQRAADLADATNRHR